MAAQANNHDQKGYFPVTHAVFGAMRDKDLAGLLAHLVPLVDHWYLSDLPPARAASAIELETAVQAAVRTAVLASAGTGAQIASAGRRTTSTLHASPKAALRAAAAAADPADRIVVFGSFFTVGGVLKDGLPRLSAPHLGP